MKIVALFAALAALAGTLVVSASASESTTSASEQRRPGPLARVPRGTVPILCVYIETNGTPETRYDVKAIPVDVNLRGFRVLAKRKVCIAGRRGLRGVRGVRGIAGSAGERGATGATGSQGATGSTGAKGDKGDVGLQGLQGIAGPKGDVGATGPAGPQGLQGLQGLKGDTGATGAQGPQGLTGPAGATGPAGPAGPQGPKGDTGAIGSLETITGGTATGDKQFTVACPVGKQAVSGGFNIQGSVTASFRSNAAGDPTGNNAWTIIQSSGAALSGTVYVYCA